MKFLLNNRTVQSYFSKLQWNKNAKYAADKDQTNRVGHIDTFQGLEFEYVALIIGNDLLYRNGKVINDYITHPLKAGHFRRLGRRQALEDDLQTIDMIIRNTYNVLFTRETKGIYLYCQNKELHNYLEEQIRLLTK